MAKCPVCKLKMSTAKGCLASHVYCNDTRYERIRAGGTRDGSSKNHSKLRYPDCNAQAGQYHHWGCDRECCPACGLQFLVCKCENVLIKGEDVGHPDSQ